MSSSVAAASPHTNLHGTNALAGAGKMGSAMLTGWLAGGLDARRVVVIEPHPSPEIGALAAQGIRLNPAAQDTGEVDTLVVAVKPQSFREAGATFRPFTGPSTLVVSIMAGTPIALWYRNDPVPEEVETHLKELLMQGKLSDIPEYVREMRNDAWVEGSGVGAHITLLWDDYDRIPPEHAALGQL